MLAIFFNGLPLGMVWGLVVWYLEGRQKSESLLAATSCSFIVASGEVKDVGRAHASRGGRILDALRDGDGFPSAVSPVHLAAGSSPGPTHEDEAAPSCARADGRGGTRVVRATVPWRARPALVVYFFLTAYRDFRDNFGAELFDQLGYAGQKAIFTKSELPVAFGVMVCLAALNLVKDNLRGLLAAFGLMAAGLLIMGLATLLLDVRLISGLSWMILIGFGSYLAYVPYGSVLFDRMIASMRFAGTAVFCDLIWPTRSDTRDPWVCNC